MDQGGTSEASVAMVGGVHGAGKTHLTAAVSKALDGEHVVASKLLTRGSSDKRVGDVAQNQRIIIDGLRELIRETTRPVIIDGHFALATAEASVSPVPVEFFEALPLKAIAVVATPLTKVKARLRERDGRILDEDLLGGLMKVEVEHARRVADALEIPFMLVEDSDRVAQVVTFFRHALR